MLEIFKKLQNFKRKLRVDGLDTHANVSFSQEAEDLVILRQLSNPREGFFVEVGALAPKRFSNTYLFSKMGWNGILIEPNPSVASHFKKFRPRDIFVNEGISAEEQILTYHQFKEPALNTFDASVAQEKTSAGWLVSSTTEIKTRPLRSVLNEFVPPGQKIRILSIDVEGFDEIVVKSNDWEKFRPEWIIVEALQTKLLDIAQSPIISFLIDQNYTPIAKTGNSIILREDDQ